MTKKSFADMRSDMIADIEAIRLRRMDPETGAVIFIGYREITANMNCEIQATKLALLTEGKAHNFGRVVRMGRRIINDNDGDDEGGGGAPALPAK